MLRIQSLKKIFKLKRNNKEKGKAIKCFIPENYYSVVTMGEDAKRKSLNGVVLLKPGVELIIQYYHEKYQTNIVISPDSSFLNSFPIELCENDGKGDYRQAFIIEMDNKMDRVVPLIYIRENAEEAFLYADGIFGTDSSPKKLAENSDIPVYAVSKHRISDAISGYMDALVFARDTTAMDIETGNYRIPGLLAQLKKRAKKIEVNYFQAKLPDELLKTAQLEGFVEYHQENTEKIIYQNETLAQFRERYMDYNITFFRENSKAKCNLPGYLRKKGLKLRDIIEMQFYRNQLQDCFPELWTVDIREQFIAEAKSYLDFKSVVQPGLQEVAEKMWLIMRDNESVAPLPRHKPQGEGRG